MSNTARIAATAANTLTKPLNVEEVFSTYLYTGTGSNHYLAMDDVDVYNEGGLYWSKGRSAGTSLGNGRHFMVAKPSLGSSEIAFYDDATASTAAASTVAEGTWMQSDGTQFISGSGINTSGTTYASWTFRKAPKFFDVVTFTAQSSGTQTINHNLGSAPASIILKSTSNTDNWVVYHKELSSTQYLTLNTTNSVATQSNMWPSVTSTSFDVSIGNTVTAGRTYVAYLFAHNDGDGDFGPTGDQDIIKCGSWTASQPSTVTLGFEPQWLLVKRVDGIGNWFLVDNMRGADFSAYKNLSPDLSNAEGTQAGGTFTFNPDGFTYNGSVLGGGNTCIYIAIRRGPMAVPESATDVFDVGDASETGSTAPEYEGGFTVDMALKRIQSASQSNYVFDRLRGGQSLITNGTSAESAFGAAKFDYMDGYYNGTSTSSANWSAMWKRAPNYFDVVAGTGTSTLDAVPHNLGVTPELIIQKKRSGSSSMDWFVTGSGVGGTNKYLILNSTAAVATTVTLAHDASTFTPIFDQNDYIAYLFATLAGVSKVGSYTGSASAQTIDCGFTAGARFVLIKRTDSTGSWVVWDTNRGIVAGNDPYFKLETNAAPTTTDDIIDPHNSGFTLAGGVGFINTSGGSYIFYAIA